jgi:hypothetical protein
MDYQGSIWVAGEDTSTAIDATITIDADHLSIVSRGDNLGSWPLDEVAAEPHGTGDFLLIVGSDDRIMFRPRIAERNSFARDVGQKGSLSDRIHAAAGTPTRSADTEHASSRSNAAPTVTLPAKRNLEGTLLALRLVVLVGFLFPFLVVSCGTVHESVEGWRLATGYYEQVDLAEAQGLDSGLLPGGSDGTQSGVQIEWWVLAALGLTILGIFFWVIAAHRTLEFVLDGATVVSLLLWRSSLSDSISAGQLFGVVVAMGGGYWVALIAAGGAFLIGAAIAWVWGWRPERAL